MAHPTASQVIGLAFATLILGLFLFNGLVMLFSPAKWFALPSYIAVHGSMRPDLFRTTWGRLQVRTVGFVFAGAAIAMIAGALGFQIPSQTRNTLEFSPVIGLVLGLVACLGGIWSGLMMFFKPKWWYEKYVTPGNPESRSQRPAMETALRIMGVPMVVIALYFAWLLVAPRL